MPNIPAALVREPAIVDGARFVGVLGSIRLGYDGSAWFAAEYHAARYPQACQKMFWAGGI